MRFASSPLELLVSAKSEDIIAHDICLAVVLMKSAVGCAVHHVAGRDNPAASFVKVDTPTAIAQAGNIVPKIIFDARPWLRAERVNAAHVAQNRTVPV